MVSRRLICCDKHIKWNTDAKARVEELHTWNEMSLPGQSILRQLFLSQKYEPSPDTKITEQACFAKVNYVISPERFLIYQGFHDDKKVEEHWDKSYG